MSKNSFGQKLQTIRKSKNLTQAQLAETAGVNEKHISKIETGVYFPTYTTLTKILKALNLNIEDVGLDMSSFSNNNSPYYLKSLQILNSAASEDELEIYYGLLKQGQKALDVYKS